MDDGGVKIFFLQKTFGEESIIWLTDEVKLSNDFQGQAVTNCVSCLDRLRLCENERPRMCVARCQGDRLEPTPPCPRDR